MRRLPPAVPVRARVPSNSLPHARGHRIAGPLVAASLLAACLLAGAAPAARADAVTDWNTIWLDCVRATGGPPCPISRAGAMVHVAIYDAVNSIDRSHEPYLVSFHAPPGCPQEAAAAVAAHDVLVHLYPGRRALLDAALAASLDDVPPGPLKQVAISLGHRVAHRVISARRRDGSDDTTPYVPGAGPGDWRPTYPDYSAPFSPNWGSVTPWAMGRGDQFRPGGPFGLQDMQALLASPGYAAMFDEVKDLGARQSPSRTPEQTQIAYFWANDVDSTYKPAGHLNHIAQVLAEDQGLGLVENARFFALLNLALADAGIAAWDCKYRTAIDFWRPIAGIREADTDGNPLTTPDPTWEPLNAFTPPFPAYISGHATFAAAAAAIFRRCFGTDQVTYTIGTDEPLYTGGPRTYHTFTEAALENGRSRVYLGVHWQFDADDGYATGTSVGDLVYATLLRPLDRLAEPGPGTRPPAGAGEVRLRLAALGGGRAARIEYELAAPGPVTLAIHDVLGRRVATLLDGFAESGSRALVWDGRAADGTPLASGVYFARIAAPGAEATAKLVVVY